MGYIKYDELTVTLSILAIALYVGHKLTVPTSMVHPMLLGRQVEVSQVRHAGESAIYRNFGVGGGTPLPTRPTTAPCTLLDLLSENLPVRSLWNTQITNAQLREQYQAIAAGFLQKINLKPRDSNVMILLNNGLEFLLADLALASISIPTLTLARLDLLADVLETYPPSSIIVPFDFLDHVLELISDHHEESGGNMTVIVVGDQNSLSAEKSKKSGIKIVRWEELVHAEVGSSLEGIQAPTANDVFTVTFTGRDEHNQPKGVQLTHQNVTAGVVALQYVFPLSKAWSPADCLLSSHSLSTPFGRAVAYTALYKGCSLITLPSGNLFRPPSPNLEEIVRLSEDPQAPPPTILIVSSDHYSQICKAVLNHAKQNWLFSYALRHKLSAAYGGELSNDTFWDKWFFKAARAKALGHRLALNADRVMVTGDPIPTSDLVSFRVALSVPVVRSLTHEIAAGPLLSSHPSDLQAFYEDHEVQRPETISLDAKAHLGPPTNNVEAKLMGVSDTDLESGSDPHGELYVRGPSIGQAVPPTVDHLSDGWAKTGYVAKVSTSGTFKVHRESKV